jgi:hypothetical protein
VAASASLYPLHGQRSNEPESPPTSDSSAKVILEVINNHFTIGQKIPSLYVKVFSDGTAECHAIKFTGRENNDVKREHLPAKEFAEIKSLLDQPEMQGVKGRYEHPRAVADSWMEWELRAPDSQLRQEVTISFGPPTQELRAFPEALGSLGCQILKIREYVYGDRAEYYSPACVAAVDHPQK